MIGAPRLRVKLRGTRWEWQLDDWALDVLRCLQRRTSGTEAVAPVQRAAA
jgi:hypothetical protein